MQEGKNMGIMITLKKPTAESPSPHPRRPIGHRHEPAFDLRAHLYRITGVALTPVPGLQALTLHTVLSAVGLAMPQGPPDKHCASW